jgi:hypothetical protein
MIINPRSAARRGILDSSRDRSGAPRRIRRGITLIEIIVVITGVATVLGMCAVTIQLLLRLNTDGQARLGASEAFDRLASQFRQDVHACNEVEIGRPVSGQPAVVAAERLRMTLGSQRVVTYEMSKSTVIRVQSGPAKPLGHESYRLGRDPVVQFESRTEGPHSFIAMIVARRGDQEPLGLSQPIEVLALRGKDRAGSSQPEEGQVK